MFNILQQRILLSTAKPVSGDTNLIYDNTNMIFKFLPDPYINIIYNDINMSTEFLRVSSGQTVVNLIYRNINMPTKFLP
jgi:hypothetical protein